MKLAQTDTDLGTFSPPTTAFSEGSEAGTGALTNLETLISTFLGIITVFASLAFIVYFLFGALKWVTAGGDSGKVQKARDQMIQGVIGLVIVVISYSVIGLIGTILGLNILQPGEALKALIPT